MIDQFNRSTAIKVAVAVGAGIGSYILYKKLRDYVESRSQKWEQVGRVSEILIYPIKSCKGRSVPEAECEPLGPKCGDYYDRRFTFADQDCKFITARDEPQLVLVDVEIDKNSFTLLAPGKEPIRTSFNDVIKAGNIVRVKLWDDMPIDAYDCGSDISAWINDYLKKPGAEKQYRLYYHTPGLFNSRRLDNFEKLAGYLEKRKDLAVFTDLCSYMLMTEGSMDDLNTRTPNGEQFSIRNFRPNFVVSGTKAFDEDNWTYVRIGEETVFKNIKPCTRCVLTTVNWATGEKHPRTEPLRTLRTYRQAKDPKEKKYFGVSPMFGVNLVVEKVGTVRVDDNVYVKYKRT